VSWATRAGTPRHTGQPLKAGQRDWNDEAMERIARFEAMEARGENPYPEHRCVAMTTGKWGPVRRCAAPAIPGATVCVMHGGSKKAVRAHAERRLLAEVDPTIDRLVVLRDQDEDLKVAFGASTQILNRTLGNKHTAGAAPPSHKVVIGLALGGLPAHIVEAQTKAALAPASEDGEVVEPEEAPDA
jgi:hypothetical protein